MQQQTAQSDSFNLSFFNTEKDKPRHRPLMKMRVRNRGTRGLQIMRQTISAGEHEIVCYDDEVDAVLAMVEDPKKIEAAREQFENDLAEEVHKSLDNYQGTTESVRQLMRSRSDARVNEVHDRVLRTTALSMPASFQKMWKRSLLPLDSAELIEGSAHPEPQRAAVQQEVDKHAKAQAQALREVAREIIAELKGASGASEAGIQAMVDARVRELLGETKAGPKGR